MHAPVVTALYTGVRRGEMLALTWADVDLDDGATLTVARSLEETRQHGVRVKAPKSERGRRRISLPALVVRALRAHRIAQLERRVATGAGRTDLVFPGPGGGQWTPSHFSVEWRRAVRKLGLPGVTWHALRHTHASHADPRRRGRGHDLQAARARHGRLHATGLRPHVQRGRPQGRRRDRPVGALTLFFPGFPLPVARMKSARPARATVGRRSGSSRVASGRRRRPETRGRPSVPPGQSTGRTHGDSASRGMPSTPDRSPRRRTTTLPPCPWGRQGRRGSSRAADAPVPAAGRRRCQPPWRRDAWWPRSTGKQRPRAAVERRRGELRMVALVARQPARCLQATAASRSHAPHRSRDSPRNRAPRGAPGRACEGRARQARCGTRNRHGERPMACRGSLPPRPPGRGRTQRAAARRAHPIRSPWGEPVALRGAVGLRLGLADGERDGVDFLVSWIESSAAPRPLSARS